MPSQGSALERIAGLALLAKIALNQAKPTVVLGHETGGVCRQIEVNVIER